MLSRNSTLSLLPILLITANTIFAAAATDTSESRNYHLYDIKTVVSNSENCAALNESLQTLAK